MNGHLRASLTSKEKILIIATLFSLIAWNFPVAIGTANAKADEQQNSLTFEIKSQNQIALNQTIAQTKSQLQEQQAAKAKMDNEVSLLRTYLQSKNSPLANYTEILLAQNDWKTIIAISNSESTLGQHCYVNNCSGIFGSKGLRTYASIPDWIVDMQNLINKRYKGWTLDKMNGIYVYPRSTSWIKASSSVYNDLSTIQNQLS